MNDISTIKDFISWNATRDPNEEIKSVKDKLRVFTNKVKPAILVLGATILMTSSAFSTDYGRQLQNISGTILNPRSTDTQKGVAIGSVVLSQVQQEAQRRAQQKRIEEQNKARTDQAEAREEKRRLQQEQYQSSKDIISVQKEVEEATTRRILENLKEYDGNESQWAVKKTSHEGFYLASKSTSVIYLAKLESNGAVLVEKKDENISISSQVSRMNSNAKANAPDQERILNNITLHQPKLSSKSSDKSIEARKL